MLDGPRACGAEEFDQVLATLNRVFRDGSDQDVRTDYPLIFDPGRRELMRVVVIEGEVVAHVPVAPRQVTVNEDTFPIAIIGGTFTLEDHQRHGYATLCLRDGVRIMRERNWPVSVLWTLERTFPFYQHSGWEAVSSQGWTYTLTANDVPKLRTSEHAIETYTHGDHKQLGTIMRLHDTTPQRINRSPDEYRMLFNLPKMHTLLALEGDDVRAYLTIGRSTNKFGLIEGGGNARAVETLVRHARSEWPANEDLPVTLPLTPCVLSNVLETANLGPRRPVEEASGIGFQMMRVNDFGLFARQIGNHMRQLSAGIQGEVCVVAEDTDEAVTLRVRDGDVAITSEQLPDSFVLSRRQLAQLAFGAHPSVPPLELEGPGADLLETLFPYYFPIWELDHS